MEETSVVIRDLEALQRQPPEVPKILSSHDLPPGAKCLILPGQQSQGIFHFSKELKLYELEELRRRMYLSA